MGKGGGVYVDLRKVHGWARNAPAPYKEVQMSVHKQHDAEPIVGHMWLSETVTDSGTVYRAVVTAKCSCGPGPYHYIVIDGVSREAVEAEFPDAYKSVTEAYKQEVR